MKRGFTLIELLMVIAIMGILSSMVLASLRDTGTKTRNTTRAQLIHQYHNAIRLYYAEHGHYPDPGDDFEHCIGSGYVDTTCTTYPPNTVVNTAFQRYLPSLPILPNVDLINPNSGPIYQCTAGSGSGECTTYQLKWYIEVPTLSNPPCSEQGIFAGGSCSGGKCVALCRISD